MPLRTVVAVLSLTAVATGQRTWIVDAANGPGTDFVDLPPAVAAASDGDRILVRGGVYSPTTISKALRIQGALSTQFATPFAALIVENIPAGRTVELTSLQMNQAAGAGLLIRACRGTVTLRDVLGTAFPAIAIADADYVAVSGRSGEIAATHATLSIVDGRVESLRDNGVALTATAAEITVADAEILGGPSHPSGSPLVLGPGTGIQMSGGQLRLASSAVVAAGPRRGLNQGTAPALRNIGGTLILDPAATLVGTGTPAIATDVTPRFEPVPGVSLDGGQVGRSLTVTLTAPPGLAAVLVASTGARPVATPFGRFVLDVAGAVTMRSGTTTPDGLLEITTTVPALPELRGVPLHFQGATAGSTVQLSTPASLLLH